VVGKLYFWYSLVKERMANLMSDREIDPIGWQVGAQSHAKTVIKVAANRNKSTICIQAGVGYQIPNVAISKKPLKRTEGTDSPGAPLIRGFRMSGSLQHRSSGGVAQPNTPRVPYPSRFCLGGFFFCRPFPCPGQETLQAKWEKPLLQTDDSLCH
jgi:hypothetical protein